MHEASRQSTAIQSRTSNLAANARRVLFFHKLLFGRPPIVVVGVPERQAADKYASAMSATRGLTDEFGLRVIVDGPPNSIPPELFATKRSNTIFAEPMTRAEIESIPELSDLIQSLKQHHIDDAVWQVLGGIPATYHKLGSLLSICRRSIREKCD